MDVQVPVAGGVAASEVGVVEAEPALTAEPQANTAVPAPLSPGRRLVRRLVSSRTARWVSAAVAWSHTRRALVLGTVVTAVAGVATAVSLVVVGFVGVGTHTPTWYAQNLIYPGGITNDASGILYGPPNPEEIPQLAPQPPAVGGPIEPSFVMSQSLATAVLQPTDVADGFMQLNAGPTGGDATRGLLASYHAVYQRLAPVIAVDGTVSIVSLIGQYDTSQAASFHLRDLDISRLGSDAGLPASKAELVEADTIGDESRVVHLRTAVANASVGAYLVQFRRGAYEAIVGVVAPLGSESLERALQLVQIEDDRLRDIASAQG